MRADTHQTDMFSTRDAAAQRRRRARSGRARLSGLCIDSGNRCVAIASGRLDGIGLDNRKQQCALIMREFGNVNTQSTALCLARIVITGFSPGSIQNRLHRDDRHTFIGGVRFEDELAHRLG